MTTVLEASHWGSLLALYDCWKMCVMMGAICSAVSKDSSWEFVWASSFILVEIFQCRLCQYQEGSCWSTMKDLLPELVISKIILPPSGYSARKPTCAASTMSAKK